MKKLLLILLCLPIIGFGQLDFGYEGPVPNIICDGDSAELYMFDFNSSNIDTPYTIIYTIDGLLQSPITTSATTLYIQQSGHYIITSWTNNTGTYDSSNSYLPFASMSPLVVDSCITSIKDNYITRNKNLIKKVDILGRETKQTNQPLFYIYDDGTVKKRIVIE